MHRRELARLSELLCAENLAEHLAATCSPAELADAVARLFREHGPALPRPMRMDLDAFIRDCSRRMLARCLAMNEPLDAREDFVRRCREQSTRET
jgi:hypothetical protein